MFIVLGPQSELPLYEQVVNEIKAKILSGELRPGAALPSIRQLASDLLISVITTKRAYQELETAGYIETRPGRGTFVSMRLPIDRRYEELRGELQEVISKGLRMGLSLGEIKDLFAQIINDEVLPR